MEQTTNIQEHQGTNGVYVMSDMLRDVMSFISIGLFVATFAMWISAL